MIRPAFIIADYAGDDRVHFWCELCEAPTGRGHDGSPLHLGDTVEEYEQHVSEVHSHASERSRT